MSLLGRRKPVDVPAGPSPAEMRRDALEAIEVRRAELRKVDQARFDAIGLPRYVRADADAA